MTDTTRSNRIKLSASDGLALRSGERLQFADIGHVDAKDARYAIHLLEVAPPSPSRDETPDGPRMSIAVIAAERVGGLWQWVSLAPATKQAIAQIMVDDLGLSIGRWHAMRIIDGLRTTTDDGVQP